MYSRRRQFHAQCKRKARYLSPDAARIELHRMQAKHGRGFLQVYSCKFCHGWHLGNALSAPEAMKRLEKLEQRMSTRFYERAPQKIQTRFHDQRMALTAYLISRM